MIQFPCDNCNKPLRVDDALAGKRAVCPHCRSVLEVPAVAAPADDPAAGLPMAEQDEFAQAPDSSSRPGRKRRVAAASAEESQDTEDAAVEPTDRKASQTAQDGRSDDLEEYDLLTVNPAWFLSRPGHGAIAILGIIMGLAFLAGAAVQGAVGYAYVGLALLAASAGTLGFWKLQSKTMTITVTTKQLIIAQGLFSRDTLEVPVREIQDIRLTQTLTERLVGIGRLSISNSSQEDDEVELKDIPNPQTLKKTIDKARKL